MATIHQCHRQTDRTEHTDRQRSDSIGQTVLQTVAQKADIKISSLVQSAVVKCTNLDKDRHISHCHRFNSIVPRDSIWVTHWTSYSLNPLTDSRERKSLPSCWVSDQGKKIIYHDSIFGAFCSDGKVTTTSYELPRGSLGNNFLTKHGMICQSLHTQ